MGGLIGAAWGVSAAMLLYFSYLLLVVGDMVAEFQVAQNRRGRKMRA